ncbi:MAG TPA: hypothetical protein VGK89_13435 [Candidatus Eisenbacteria bacterium]|jgi:hypothetical protein
MRRLSYAALLTAAGLTGAYAETIPNFEVLTFTAFCAGILLGARDGALTAAIMMLVFSLLNPYGAAQPLITVSQVVGEIGAGVAGGVLASVAIARTPAPVRALTLALTGAVVTLFFDLVTNLATGYLLGQVRLTLLGGIPFSLWHVGTNVALFAAIGTPLVGALSHYRSRLSPSR